MQSSAKDNDGYYDALKLEKVAIYDVRKYHIDQIILTIKVY